jgi:hypothetical protein
VKQYGLVLWACAFVPSGTVTLLCYILGIYGRMDVLDCCCVMALGGSALGLSLAGLSVSFGVLRGMGSAQMRGNRLWHVGMLWALREGSLVCLFHQCLAVLFWLVGYGVLGCYALGSLACRVTVVHGSAECL